VIKKNITKLFSHRTNFLYKFTVSIIKTVWLIKVKRETKKWTEHGANKGIPDLRIFGFSIFVYMPVFWATYHVCKKIMQLKHML
jgi:hypothetical protein